MSTAERESKLKSMPKSRRSHLTQTMSSSPAITLTLIAAVILAASGTIVAVSLDRTGASWVVVLAAGLQAPLVLVAILVREGRQRQRHIQLRTRLDGLARALQSREFASSIPGRHSVGDQGGIAIGQAGSAKKPKDVHFDAAAFRRTATELHIRHERELAYTLARLNDALAERKGGAES